MHSIDEIGRYHFIKNVLVAFKNNYSIKDVVILKQDDTNYNELEYDLTKLFIVKDSNKIKEKKGKNYCYKNIITLDDDLYDFVISIDNN